MWYPLEWVAYPFSSRFPNPRIELGSPALQVDFLPTELWRNILYSTLFLAWFLFCILFHSLPPLTFSLIQFSHSVMSNSLWPHGLQHARTPCPSPTPQACSDSCPLSRWCPSNHLILCRPLLLLPSIFPSIRVFSNDSALNIKWPKYSSFSFSISPSNEYSGLISFRVNWFDLLGVQGTLKSLPQHHNLKASILQCSAFFMVQLSHPYMTTGKTMTLTTWTSNDKMMSLFFNTLSGFVIALLPRSKHPLILWLQWFWSPKK